MTAETYFYFIIFCSLWCLGFFAITRKGKLFDFVEEFVTKILGSKQAQKNFDSGTASFLDHVKLKIADPTFSCCTCMASVHSFIIYLLYCHFTGNSFMFLTWISIAIPVAFMNEILWATRTYFVKKNELTDLKIKMLKDANH